MGTINVHTKELSLKLVYYGPGLAGKTTSLKSIHGALPADRQAKMVSIATETERTLHFDFLPIQAAKVRDLDVRLHLYTVPGQVFYKATREIVLRGVDGVVFVADSQPAMRDANLASLDDLADNLVQQARTIDDTPLIFQYNKRDLPEVMPVEQMEEDLNQSGRDHFLTVATNGDGVSQALRTIANLSLKDFVARHRVLGQISKG